MAVADSSTVFLKSKNLFAKQRRKQNNDMRGTILDSTEWYQFRKLLPEPFRFNPFLW